MADNVAVTPGAGATIATDDVGGAQYQRVKLDGGDDGVSLPLLGLTVPPNSTTTGLPTRECGQDAWVCSFADTGTLLSSDFTELRLGTGVGRTQASGSLLITAGTTVNAEWLARSNQSFSGAMLMRCKTILSQRNANNNFAVLLADRIGDTLAYSNATNAISITIPSHGFTSINVGQFLCLGGITASSGTAVPGRFPIASITDANTIVVTGTGWVTGAGTVCVFGWHYARLVYTGATATTMLFDVARRGWSDTQVSATINTTLTGHIAQIHLDGRNAYLGDMLVASSSSIVARGSRVENIPDDARPLYLYLWSYNGTSAPSATTWTIGFAAVEDYANMPVYVAGQRQQGSASPAPVTQVGTVTVTGTVTSGLSASSNLIGDVGVEYRANATGAATIKHIIAAAGTNAAFAKASAGRLLGWHFVNTTAAVKYVRIYNLAVAPTVGTSTVAQTIGVPANGISTMKLEGGIGYATGIAYSITGASPDNDTTGVAAGDVVGDLFYA